MKIKRGGMFKGELRGFAPIGGIDELVLNKVKEDKLTK